ncbi:MAG: hypothetical protein AAGA18_16080 [Verrucomicrobiota bacterium]
MELTLQNPTLEQHRMSNQLRQEDTRISGGGRRSIWLRDNLHTFKLRIRALEV